jgi:hypothetical protein
MPLFAEEGIWVDAGALTRTAANISANVASMSELGSDFYI